MSSTSTSVGNSNSHEFWIPWVTGVCIGIFLMVGMALVCWCLRHRVGRKLALENLKLRTSSNSSGSHRIALHNSPGLVPNTIACGPLVLTTSSILLAPPPGPPLPSQSPLTPIPVLPKPCSESQLASITSPTQQHENPETSEILLISPSPNKSSNLVLDTPTTHDIEPLGGLQVICSSGLEPQTVSSLTPGPLINCSPLPVVSANLTQSIDPVVVRDPASVITMAMVTPQLRYSRPISKGLLKSRRGSHTSLTLSLSPSIDSLVYNPAAPGTPCLCHQSTLPSTSLAALTHDVTGHHSHHIHPPAVATSSLASHTRLIGNFQGTSREGDQENLARAGHRLTRAELKRKVTDNPGVLFKEFWEIPMNHASKWEVPVLGIGNKNRYQTIIPNEASRVTLSETNNDPLSTYINANYIHGYGGGARTYIATQGPMTHTIDDFWRMVWETESPAIVMITNLVEKNKRKCECYLPNNQCSQQYGPLIVSVVSCDEHPGYVVRRLLVRHEISGEERSCVHFWYTTWPDHATPATTRQLLRLVSHTESYLPGHSYSLPTSPCVISPSESNLSSSSKPDTENTTPDRYFPSTNENLPVKPSSSNKKTTPSAVHRNSLTTSSNRISLSAQSTTKPNGPSRSIIVHCSAGLGRTGCFIALCIGCQMLRNEGCVDVLEIVSRMRLDRGGLVQTNEQYEFIHHALASYDSLKDEEPDVLLITNRDVPPVSSLWLPSRLELPRPAVTIDVPMVDVKWVSTNPSPSSPNPEFSFSAHLPNDSS